MKKNKAKRILKNKIFFLFGLGILLIGIGLFSFKIYNENNQANITYNYPYYISPTPTPLPTAPPPKSYFQKLQKANPNPMQRSCPDGFYYYENSQYSVCYPSTLIPYIETGVVDPQGKDENNVVIIPDSINNATIELVPSFEFASGNDSCLNIENAQIAGYPSVRWVRKATAAHGCGSIYSIMTVVENHKRGGFVMIYQSSPGGTLKYLNEYSVMEQSLKIK